MIFYRTGRAGKLGLRTLALGYLAMLLLLPVGMIFTAPSNTGWLRYGHDHHAERDTRVLVSSDRRDRRPPELMFGIGMALQLERGSSGGDCSGSCSICRSRSPVVVGLAGARLRHDRLVWELAGGPRNQVIFSVPGMVSRPRSSRCRSSPARRCPCCAGWELSLRGRPPLAQLWQTFWRVTLPAIRWGVVWRGANDGTRARGVRCRQRRVRRILGQTQTLPLACRQLWELDTTGPTRQPWCFLCWHLSHCWR
jgi:sulfate transport system permease protein